MLFTRRRLALIIALGALLVITVAATVAVSVFYSSYQVPSGSMEPSIAPGTYVLARDVDGEDVGRGDVVMYESPVAGGQGQPAGFTRIARVIAVGGERIATDDGRVTIDGRVLDESYLAARTRTDGLEPVTVPGGSLYLMGDSRPFARDSRADGPVPVGNVSGRVDLELRLGFYLLIATGVVALILAVVVISAFTRRSRLRQSPS